MYPEFIKVAEAEDVEAAVDAFFGAKAAEAGHAKLYQSALDNLDAWKGGKKDFFVCEQCGNTVQALTFEKCPVCGKPKEKFIKIS
jgi:rubrerythrin